MLTRDRSMLMLRVSMAPELHMAPELSMALVARLRIATLVSQAKFWLFHQHRRVWFNATGQPYTGADN